MRLCHRCRELGYICATCTVVLFGTSPHDLHAHEDQKQQPPRQVRLVVASTTASTSLTTEWSIVPGTSKWFRRIPPPT